MEHFNGLINCVRKFMVSSISTGYVFPIALVPFSSGYFLNKWKRYRKMSPFRTKQEVNIFKDYCVSNRILVSISYGDTDALKNSMKVESGHWNLKSEVNLKNRPNNKSNRNFVMSFLKYIPAFDLSGAYKYDFSFAFDIRATENINGIRLEVKNYNMDIIFDKFVETTTEFAAKNYKINEKLSEDVWREIKEICFTLFTEEKYIEGVIGWFEIRDFRLVKNGFGF